MNLAVYCGVKRPVNTKKFLRAYDKLSNEVSFSIVNWNLALEGNMFIIIH